MNCPMHILIYRARGRSYRELPLRLFEFGTVYRYEKSGVVHGLTRVRGLTMDDAHIFCTRDQMGAELKSLLNFVLDLLRDYGLADFYLELSTRDEARRSSSAATRTGSTPPRCSPRRPASPAWSWSPTPAAPRSTGRRSPCRPRTRSAAPGSCPPSSSTSTSPSGSAWSTRRRTAPGSEPIMIHRALFGSIERFFGILIEHYAGAFPPWLAPVQVAGIPIADAHVPYLEEVAAKLREHGIRVEVDDSDDRMQKKIRNAQKQKVPFMLLAGDDDVAAGAVSFRYRNGAQKNGVPWTRRSPRSSPRWPTASRSDRPARAGQPRALCCIHVLPGARDACAAGRGWVARWVPAAVDAAPDGLHQG